MSEKYLLITGGAGFIGLNFVKWIMQHEPQTKIFVVDKFTYASNPAALKQLAVNYCQLDIACDTSVQRLFQSHTFTHVINFAAESHVDNSIQNAQPFIDSNITGTVNLLKHSATNSVKKFVQISTDEVFGQIAYPHQFDENSPHCARNPYSASKAAAENFVMAWANTYGLDYTIINSSNNYGPGQHTEKLIPKTITNIIENKKIPIYGSGSQIRDWLHVDDTCDAIVKIINGSCYQQRFCIGGGYEIDNISLVKKIINFMGASHDLIEYVNDRPGHDTRYSTNYEKIQQMLHWSPKIPFDQGLQQTIQDVKNANRI
jgi:dTDP-glucose 4,6-dehydratase